MHDRPKRPGGRHDEPEHEVEEPRRPSFGAAAVWSLLMEGATQFGALVVSFVLAAMLGPAVYGVVSMAMLYVMVFQIVPKSFIAALIQRRGLTDAHLSTGFWLTVGSSIVLMVVGSALGGLWADINDTPELSALILGLSVLLPIHAIGVAPEALLRRRLNFRSLTVRAVIATTISGVLGVAAALAGAGAWALVVQQLTFAASNTLMASVAARWVPRFEFSPRRARELIGFSSGTLLAGLGDFLNRRFDVLLIGLFFGPAAVGFFRFGARLLELVLGAVSRGVMSLALPDLAPQAVNRGNFVPRYLRLARLGAAVELPLTAALAAIAYPLFNLLGPEWTPGVAAFQVLCLAHAIRVLGVIDGQALQALGRPHLVAVLTWIGAVGSTLAFVVSAVALRDVPLTTQIVGIATVRAALSATLFLGIHCYVSHWVVGAKYGRVFEPFARPAAVALFTLGLGWFVVQTALVSDLPPLVQILLTGITSVSGAAAMAYTLALEPYIWITPSKHLHGKHRQTF